MTRRIRLAAVMTHPIQYYSPWFRFIEREVDELDLTVLYMTEPSPAQQGAGFEQSFEWDVPLREGYKSVVLRSANSSDRLSSERFFGIDAPSIGAAIERLEPDAVLLSGWHSIALVRAILACRRRGIRLLYRGDTHLQGRARGVKHAFWRFRARRLLGLFDRFLCVGEKARQYFEYFGIPTQHIFRSPHAVDNDFFASRALPFQKPEARARARNDWCIPCDDRVVLFVGKLEVKKRPTDLVRAVALLNGRARVLVVGSGPLQKECQSLASRLAVAADFRGFMNQSELPRAYAISDCLALPSHQTETWGLVVNEAMATGLPCVVSEGVGCAPDLVEAGETGEIFPVGDVDRLAARLDLLLSEMLPGRARADKCRKKVSGYSFESATDGLVSACWSVMR